MILNKEKELRNLYKTENLNFVFFYSQSFIIISVS